MLSFVDFYHPKYFLLENVLGILDWKATNNGIEMGISKFIMRTATSLGYVTLAQCELNSTLIIDIVIRFTFAY